MATDPGTLQFRKQNWKCLSQNGNRSWDFATSERNWKCGDFAIFEEFSGVVFLIFWIPAFPKALLFCLSFDVFWICCSNRNFGFLPISWPILGSDFPRFSLKAGFPKFRTSRKYYCFASVLVTFVFLFQIEIFDFSQFPDPFWFRFSAIFVEGWFSKIPAIPKTHHFACVLVSSIFFKSRFSTLAHLRFAILQFEIWNAEKS